MELSEAVAFYVLFLYVIEFNLSTILRSHYIFFLMPPYSHNLYIFISGSKNLYIRFQSSTLWEKTLHMLCYHIIPKHSIEKFIRKWINKEIRMTIAKIAIPLRKNCLRKNNTLLNIDFIWIHNGSKQFLLSSVISTL